MHAFRRAAARLSGGRHSSHSWQCLRAWRSLSVAAAGDAQLTSGSALPGVQLETSSVRVRWPEGGESSFHGRWLWFNADEHREPASGQRDLTPAALAHAPQLRSVAHTENGLRVEWTRGAPSTFAWSWLRANDYSDAALARAHARATPSTLTAAARDDAHMLSRSGVTKKDVPTFEYEEILGSEAAVWQWLRALNEFGLTIVRGAPTEHGTVLRVASRVAAPMRTIYGEMWDVAVMPNPINIAYAPVMLDLHIDLVYYESPPGLQLLHCRQFDDDIVGGESTFMDGFLAAQELRRRAPAAFATLLRVPATFQKVHYDRNVPAHIVAQRPHIVIDRSGGHDDITGDITGVFWAPPFEGPLRVPSRDVDAYYDAYTTFAQLLQDLEAEGRHMIQYRMQPGDISVFNNRRMLHGRRTFNVRAGGTAGAQRVLQGCYVNVDEYKSRLHHLCSVYGGADFVRRVANQSCF